MKSISDAELNILLAFDSFKGSAKASEVCDFSAKLLADHLGNAVNVTRMPFADGGEGSLDALFSSRCGLVKKHVRAQNAVGRFKDVTYLLDPSTHTAYIEVARVVGLPELTLGELEPLTASSYGVGKTVAHALMSGAKRLVLFLGGSATTDGGAGILEALGARLLDTQGDDIPLGGGALSSLNYVDISRVKPEILNAEWIFISDIKAPLLGRTGAALRYSPQKGASPMQAENLEISLSHAATVLEDHVERDLRYKSGLGAAGGMALFPSAFFSTQIVDGGAFFATELLLDEALASVDIVFTGEGKFDAQSMDGKVVGTVLKMAQKQTNPPITVVVAGDISEGAKLRADGLLKNISGIFSISESASDLNYLQEYVLTLLPRKVLEITSLLISVKNR